MMRAGKLDKTIVIERFASTVDEFGTVTEDWTAVATVRAQIIQATTEEFLRSFGETTETALIFRVRNIADLTPADRVTYEDRPYNIREIKELGRRAGLDLRCVAQGA